MTKFSPKVAPDSNQSRAMVWKKGECPYCHGDSVTAIYDVGKVRYSCQDCNAMNVIPNRVVFADMNVPVLNEGK